MEKAGSWQLTKNLFASCQELLFPSLCLGCRSRLPFRALPLFCDECRPHISCIRSPRCPCCGVPFISGDDHWCGACLKQEYAFTLARSALYYQPPVSALISELKFSGSMTGLASLALLARMSPGLKDLSPPDLIVPVPLHKKKLRQRGFNQALLLARVIFPGSRKRINSTVLIRNRHTQPQTRLNGAERRRNLSGAFTVIQAQKVFKSRILLVDDVFTTGSTVSECARILRRAGAARVEVLTLARAL